MKVEHSKVGTSLEILMDSNSTSVPKLEGTSGSMQHNEYEQECEIDLDFYRLYYPDLSDFSSEQLLAHWKSMGREEQRHANPEAALISALSDPLVPQDFDVKAYVSLNPDVGAVCRYDFQAVTHYLRQGMGEERRYNNGSMNSVNSADCSCDLEIDEADRPRFKTGCECAVTESDVSVVLLSSDNDSEINNSRISSLDIEFYFDCCFYRSYYNDLAHLDDDACLSHWLSTGRDEGRFSKLGDVFESLRTNDNLPEDFNTPSYVCENPDLVSAFTNCWEYAQHYLYTGLTERRKFQAVHVDHRYLYEKYGVKINEKLSAKATLKELKRQLVNENNEHYFLSESEYLRFSGMRDNSFLSIFDHEAYIYDNGRLHEDLSGANRAACLEHFLNIGIELNYQISADQYFNAQFYYEEYRTELSAIISYSSSLDARDWELPAIKSRLYKHWINHGISDGKMPNLRIWALKTLGFKLPAVIEKAIPLYLDVNSNEIERKNPTAVLEHYIFQGIANNLVGVVHSNETYETHCLIANMLAIQGDRKKSIAIFDQVLRNCETHPIALHHMSDELLKGQLFGQAVKGYSIIIDRSEATQWAYLNISEAYKSLVDYRSAAKYLALGAMRFPNDLYLKSQSEKLNEEYFFIAHDRAKKEGRHGDIDLGRETIVSAFDQFPIVKAVPPRQTDSKRIAIVGNHDLPQCRLYRIEQKTQHLESAGYTVDVFQHTMPLDRYYTELCEYTAVLFYRVPALPSMIKAIKTANSSGIPTVYDVDDLIYDGELFPPPLETYSGQISKSVHSSLAIDVPLFEYAMRLCQYGIASTPTLAKSMSAFVASGKVSLHRNGLSLIHSRYTSDHRLKIATDVTTVFYGSGTKAHKDDFYSLLVPAMTRLYAKHKEKIRFLIVGDISPTVELEELGSSLLLLSPLQSIESYWQLMQEEADINVAVLSRTDVTDAKSEIKWIEAAMMSIPSVVSDTSTYCEVIEDGETGLICDCADEFFKSIDLLVSDKHLRSSIGSAAHRQVVNQYSITEMGKNIDSIITSYRPSVDISKLKVAVVNVFFPPESIGGATRVVFDNVNELFTNYKDKVDVKVFCTSSDGGEPYSEKRYSVNGISVTSVACSHDPQVDHRLSDAQMGGAFRKFLGEFQPDLVHFHCIQRLSESIVNETRRAAIPYLITAHDGWWISDQQFLIDKNEEINLYDYGKRAVERIGSIQGRSNVLEQSIRSAEAVLSVSKPFAKLYEATGLTNVRVVDNGVSPIEPIAKKESRNGKIRLAHIGGMERHKGLYVLRHALKSSSCIENMELMVIDHAAAPGSMRRERWGDVEVTFLPKTPQESVSELYSTIDILIAPSIWPESFGLVTREAVLCGCWVIASDRGAVGTDVQQGLNGYVVSVDTPEPLRNLLETIDADKHTHMKSPDFESSMKSNTEQVKELVEIYESIAAESAEKRWKAA